MDNAISNPVAQKIVKQIEATLQIPSSKIDITADFEEIGIDSIIALELVNTLSKAFDVELSVAQFAEATNILELAEIVDACLPESFAGIEQTNERQQTPKAEADAEQVANFAKAQLGIALSSAYQSADQAIDSLVENHYQQLLEHYQLAEQTQPSQSVSLDDIAIIGVATRLPGADTAEQFWQNLMAQKCAVSEIPANRWDWHEHYSENATPGKSVSRWGAFISDHDCFDAEFFGIDQAQAELMDPQLRLLHQEVYNAFSDAGMAVDQYRGSQTGVFVGYEYAEYEQYLRHNAGRFEQQVALSSSSTGYYLANRLSFTFDFVGPSEAININCASSAVAFNRAYQALRSGECEQAIAAGVCLNLFADDYITASTYGLLSASGQSAAFDENADGFTRGEAVVAVLLAPMALAQQHHSRIYAVVKACGQNNRGHARNVSEIKHESISQLLRQTRNKANIAASDIRYIEVDGYCTRWGDAFEFEGIKNAFSEVQGKQVALGSYKGNVGHSEPASGLVALVKVAMSLYHGCIPPSITRKTPSRFVDFDSQQHPLYFADKAIALDDIRNTQPVLAAVNSFADSGSNIHIVLQEYQQDSQAQTPESAQLIVLSAKTSAALEQMAAELKQHLGQYQGALANLAFTLQTGRNQYQHRLALVADNLEQLSQRLQLWLDNRQSDAFAAEGLYYGQASDNRTQSKVTLDVAQQGDWTNIATTFISGATVDFSAIWPQQPRPVSLPSYPFAKTAYWAKLKAGSVAAPEAKPESSDTQLKDDNASALAPAQFYFSQVADEPPQDALALSQEQKCQTLLCHAIARHEHGVADAVDINADFISQGLSSLAIAFVVEQVADALGCFLSPSVLFSYPSVAQLSGYLCEQYSEALNTLVVTDYPLEQSKVATTEAKPRLAKNITVALKQSGDKAPLFAIAGADGNVLTFRQLLSHFDKDRPLYSFEAPASDGVSAPFETMAQTAEYYYEGIKKLQHEGPYHLLGYSNGGVGAFALAKLLLDKGDKVASLTLLDTPCPAERDYQVEQEMALLFSHLANKLGGNISLDSEHFNRLDEASRPAYLYGLLREQGLAFGEKEFNNTYRIATNSEQQCRGYELSLLPKGPQTLVVRARDSHLPLASVQAWSNYLSDKADMVEIPCDHFALVEGDAIADVAKRLNAHLQQAEQPSAGKAATASTGNRKRTPARPRKSTKGKK